jgi:hypothetical protein
MFDPNDHKQSKPDIAVSPKGSPAKAIKRVTVFPSEGQAETIMKTTKFLVKVNRGGVRVPEYVQRIDRTPVEMTTNRKLALMMGKFTAEDTIKSIHTSKCSPELVPVEVKT